MFCSIKSRENKYKENVYNIYLSERQRIDGKVKSSDTFILSLSQEDIKSNHYKDIIKNNVEDEHYTMIIEKLDKYIEQHEEEFIDNSAIEFEHYKNEVKEKYTTIHENSIYRYKKIVEDLEKRNSELYSSKQREIAKLQDTIDKHDAEVRKLKMEVEHERKFKEMYKQLADFKDILSSDTDSTTTISKSEYRKLAKVCHPDNGGSSELMNIIGKLYNK